MMTSDQIQVAANAASLEVLVRQAEPMGEEPDWPEWLDNQSTDELLELIGEVSHQLRNIKAVRDHLHQILAGVLGEGGAVTDGNTFYRFAKGGKRVVVDPQTLFSFLGEDAREVFNANYARITAFRKVAERRAVADGSDDPDAFVKAMERTLFHWEEDPNPSLKAMPVDSEYAPEYAKNMEAGKIKRYGE